MATSLIEQFSAAQQNNQMELQALIKQFEPLLQKYAYQLEYEDGKSDLVVFMIKFIQTVNLNKFEADAQLTAYLKVSVKHEFYHLLKKYRKRLYSEQPTEHKDLEKLQQNATIDANSDFNIDISWPKKFTKKEQDILYLHYGLDYSIAEIATMQHISRQAVNQLKNRALKKIKGEF